MSYIDLKKKVFASIVSCVSFVRLAVLMCVMFIHSCVSSNRKHGKILGDSLRCSDRTHSYLIKAYTVLFIY